jgi:tetratricopeptide (TPR) repeat protein
MNMIHGPGSYAAPPGATFDRAPRGRGSRSRLTAIVWAAAFAPMLLSGSGSANEMVGSAPMASPPEQSATVEAGTGGLSQETATASRSRLTNDEIETVLPHLIRSSEARHLAAALAFLIRQGDFPAAKRLLEGAVEASSFAVLASDWLHEPRLLAMLHDHGISGADPSSHPDLTAQVSELKAALEQERKRGEALAREHAALQATQVTRDRPETVYATASTPLPEETSRIRPPATPRSLALAPASADNPLLKRAAALMRSGDIVGARLLLERASEAEDVRAIVLLAETYDPRALSRLGVLGLRGDADKAEELYARARALENRQRLSRSQSAR